MPLGVSSPRNKAPIDIILDGMPYIDIPGAFVNSGDFYPPV